MGQMGQMGQMGSWGRWKGDGEIDEDNKEEGTRGRRDLGKGRRPEEALGGGQSEQPTSRMPEIGDWRLEVGRPGRLLNQRRAQSFPPPG
jgi:hypothetical protein